MIFVFDGSMEGLLTAVFEYFERKPRRAILISNFDFQPSAFEDALQIEAQLAKADRVWEGLQKQLSKEHLRSIYWAFLSEQKPAYQAIFRTVISIFSGSPKILDNYGHPDAMLIAQFTRSVGRERHRMEAFIRFKLLADGLYFAYVAPDFNVLPIIAKHFAERYADQQWLIFDSKRKYGIYFDLNHVTEVIFDVEVQPESTQNTQQLDDREDLFGVLWRDYFKSTNIAARKNTKLHLRHVPKRYWKYLTEKQIY